MKFLRYITVALSVAMMASCGSHSGHDGHDHEAEGHDHEHEEAAEGHDHDHDHGEGAHAGDEIILPPAKAAAAGVKVDTVRTGEFSGVIKAAGRILPATGDEKTVVAKVAGVVRLARPWTEGMPVGAGAAVATVSTSGMVDGDVSERARIDLDRARAEFERAGKLRADRLVTEREYEAAKADYERASVAYRSVGNSRGGALGITAPAGGFVKQLMVRDGDFVDVGAPIMTVTQNRNLYLRAEVPQRHYRELPQISSAKFKTAYGDGRVYDLADMGGRLVTFSRTGGDGSAFIPVTFEFDNVSDVLPDSYAEIYLVTSPRQGVVTVPAGAITEEQGAFFVYIQVDEEGYMKREVKLGQSDGERTEVTAGLVPGERYVSEGAVHVKLASAKAIPGHTHNH